MLNLTHDGLYGTEGVSGPHSGLALDAAPCQGTSRFSPCSSSMGRNFHSRSRYSVAAKMLVTETVGGKPGLQIEGAGANPVVIGWGGGITIGAAPTLNSDAVGSYGSLPLQKLQLTADKSLPYHRKRFQHFNFERVGLLAETYAMDPRLKHRY